jgi:NAD(P)-dependent dehydrogenase (short-subunit alcohol dehydrogenase family)
MELWGSGIRIATVNPGVIDTGIHTITTEKVGALQASRFARAYKRYLGETPKGLPSSAVAEVIVDAISAAKPKQRYIIGSAKEKLGIKLRPLIPDSVFYSQVARRILS